MPVNKGEIKFIKETHEYFLGSVKLSPVSTIINSYFEEFDSVNIAKRYAKKRDLSWQEVIKGWEAKGKESRDFGTKIHKYCENKINGKSVLVAKDLNEYWYRIAVDSFLEDFKHSIRQSEVMVYDEEMLMAGTVDIVGDNYLADLKTSKEISKKNNYGKKCWIFPEYDDCNFIKYSLQLSYYKLLGGFKDFNLKIIHLRPGRYEIIDAIDFSNDLK